MKKGLTLVELIIVLGVLAIIFAIIFLPFIRWSDLGEGTHVGYITAVDQRGYIWRNYDVYFKTNNSSSQEDLYCIPQDQQENLAKKAKFYAESGERVSITYHGVRGIGPWLCSQGAEITEVEVSQ